MYQDFGVKLSKIMPILSPILFVSAALLLTSSNGRTFPVDIGESTVTFLDQTTVPLTEVSSVSITEESNAPLNYSSNTFSNPLEKR